MRNIMIGALCVGMVMNGLAQEAASVPQTPPKNWFNLDPVENQVNGVSTEKAYQLLQGRNATSVVVAVIDSGIDIEHEDLKDVIWVNKDEIPGNGIDDDNNGYIDDIHGWNFLGGKDGRNVDGANLEVTRLYKLLSEKFTGVSESQIAKEDKAQYELWQEVRVEYEQAASEAQNQYAIYEGITRSVQRYNKLFEAYLDTEEVTYQKIASIESKDAIIDVSRRHLMVIYEATDDTMALGDLLAALEGDMEQLSEGALYHYNLDFNAQEIVGDDPNKLDEVGYGNNDVSGKGTDNFHGTHVAGIIAAGRGNGLGMDGVASNVEIMAIRAVPGGDERDKDVANAIRYAVDNGARVVNMSFGKGFSPNKDYVSEAIAYAREKGVLLIHAAGNDGEDIDKVDNFPNDKFGEFDNAWPNWVEVGASSWGSDEDFIGSFSNFGRKSVDIFAPGVKIYSTAPGNDYEDAQGTSMASPVVAGVAAMLLSYFPDLTAEQVKDVMMRSVRKLNRLKVYEPGSDKLVKFSKLSVSGGIVNAYEAAKLAMSMNLGSQK